MNGLLRDYPLAELICEISNARLTGALRVSRERARGVLYFEEGQVVGAVTNLRASRLAEILRRRGAPASGRFDSLLSDGMTDEQAGAALLAAGAVAPEELDELRVRQATEALRFLLQWTSGDWGFDPRVRLDEQLRLRIEVGSLLVECARHLPADFVAKRLGDTEETLSPADAATPDVDALPELLPSEGFVFSRLQTPTRMSELLASSGLDEMETRRAVYALTLSGLLTRGRPVRAFTDEMLARARAPRAQAAPAPAPKGPATPAPTAPEAKPAGQEPDARAEVDELFSRAARASLYEVLGVGRDVGGGEVKRAYYALAKRFHPDRFSREAVDEALRQRVESAFSKISQAYEVLKDDKLRAAYDLKLGDAAAAVAPNASRAGGAAAAAGASGEDILKRAEERFQSGMSALQQKNLELAKQYLGEAALLAPMEPRYRAYYGRALAYDRQTRRQAEVELQAAIGLDGRNVAYRVMLAELYRDIGLKRRAEGELERALQLEPQNDAARRLLGEVRGAG